VRRTLRRWVRWDENGQTVVLVALLFGVLTGFMALAVDGGRFYMERRFLQNAVDAAALKCVQAKINGANNHDSQEAAERQLMNYNLQKNPLGIPINIQYIHDDWNHVYEPNIPSNERNLVYGVKITSRGCRVALRVDVPMLFMRILSPGLATVELPANAYAKWSGGFLPIVAARYEDPPSGPTYHDRMKQSTNDSANCPQFGPDNCPDATFSNPGRAFPLMGQGAKAYNDSQFRGNIVLDIRDFETTTHTGYNGVNGDANPDTLKEFSAAWIIDPWGYPGPDLCIADPINFLRCAQVAVTNGNTAGIYLDYMNRRYQVGDYIMLQVYDGYVKAIPDFYISGPTVVNIGTTEIKANVGTFSIVGSAQFKAPGTSVSLTIEGDAGDPDNPIGQGTMDEGILTPAACSPAPPAGEACAYGQPDFSAPWTALATTGARQGIYQIYAHGAATAPYEQITHDFPMVLNVGNQTRDFDTAGSESNKLVDPKGPSPVNFTLNVKPKGGWATPVTLSVENCPIGQPGGPPYNCYFGGNSSQDTITITPAGGGTNVQFTIANTVGLISTEYPFKIRVKGNDDVGNPVTHIIHMRLDVETSAGGATKYVDVLGYGLFRITRVDSNTVEGQAVTGMKRDPNDPILARGKRFRLVPWDQTP